MTWPSARRIAAVFMDGAGPGGTGINGAGAGAVVARRRRPAPRPGTVHSDLAALAVGRRYIRCISSRFNGRPPRRPNTATWLPLSSTARSRSSPFEIASAGFVRVVGRNQRRRRPRAEAERARRRVGRDHLEHAQPVLAVGDVARTRSRWSSRSSRRERRSARRRR